VIRDAQAHGADYPRPWQAAWMSDLQAAFEQAQADVKTLTKRPSNDDLGFLYGHYKQATEGDVTGKRPGRFDLVGRGKYDAWAGAEGLSADEAMQRYIDKVAALLG
jgi:acyl-CoA-binding protein